MCSNLASQDQSKVSCVDMGATSTDIWQKSLEGALSNLTAKKPLGKRHCCYGECNSDERYPERIVGVTFLPFPKPKTRFEVCEKWIKACGRLRDELNPDVITKNFYVCSKHFVDGKPSDQHPYPSPHGGEPVQRLLRGRKPKNPEKQNRKRPRKMGRRKKATNSATTSTNSSEGAGVTGGDGGQQLAAGNGLRPASHPPLPGGLQPGDPSVTKLKTEEQKGILLNMLAAATAQILGLQEENATLRKRVQHLEVVAKLNKKLQREPSADGDADADADADDHVILDLDTCRDTPKEEEKPSIDSLAETDIAAARKWPPGDCGADEPQVKFEMDDAETAWGVMAGQRAHGSVNPDSESNSGKDGRTGHGVEPKKPKATAVGGSTASAAAMRKKAKRPNVCHHCGVVFMRPSRLREHILIHTGEKPHCCIQCGASFRLPHMLRKHIQTHSDEKRYSCPQCDKAFKTSEGLRGHMIIHSGEKPYMCSVCGTKFRWSNTLKEHMRIHAGEKPYECPQCHGLFRRSGDLGKHMRVHTGEKPYLCQQCGAAFNMSGSLKEHMRIHTGEKPHVCQQCGIAFRTSSALWKHSRIHTGEKPFICQMCGTAFNQSSTLTLHMRIHTGEKPHVCQQCGAAYRQSGCLQKHLLTHKPTMLTHKPTNQQVFPGTL